MVFADKPPLVTDWGLYFMVDTIREQTMRKRLGDRASRLVNNAMYLPRVRAVQNQTTPEEFDMICEIAEHGKNPPHYFMSMISKAKIDGTLQYARRLLKRSVEAISYVARKIGNITRPYLNYIGDKIAEGHYSMAQVVNMVEIAERKHAPDRYLVGILKKGFTPYAGR